jgi:hypothetical protein
MFFKPLENLTLPAFWDSFQGKEQMKRFCYLCYAILASTQVTHMMGVAGVLGTNWVV